MTTQIINDNQPDTGSNHKFGLSSNALKGIAIFAMLIDHLAITFVPDSTPLWILMRFIGRFTAPLMFYQSVEGYHHTRDANKYTLRLAIFAIISYVPFIFFATNSLPNASNFYNLNVIYTILLGVIAIRARNEIKNPMLKVLIILATLVLSIFGDLAYMCVIMMLAMDYFYGNFKNQIFAYLLVIMGINQLLPIFLQPITGLVYEKTFDFSSYWSSTIMFGLLIPIYLISRYNGKKGGGGNFSKWGFYIFYPLHMLILGLIKYYVL